MGQTNDRLTKALSLVVPTSLNLQPRPFAPLESEEKDETIPKKSGYSENFLKKIINTPSSESATPVQRKSGNRLKAIAAERMNPEPPPVQRKSGNRLKAIAAERQMAIQAKQSTDAESVVIVQRKSGNKLKAIAAERMAIQAKLTIGQPNDKYEQEADATGARVVQQIHSSTTSQGQPVQRQDLDDDDELQMKPLVQRRENIGGGEASTDLESAIQNARGSGQSLDSGLQESMGQAMGADFSSVKVHTDSESDQLNKSIQAKAFTTGQDLFFRQGAYEPSSQSGQELIAHELTHVVQQNGGAVQRKRGDVRRKVLPKPLQQVPQISDAPTEQVQRLIDKEFFRDITKQTFKKRGKTFKAIEKLLEEYNNIDRNKAQGKGRALRDSLDILDELKEHTNNWLSDHEGDTSTNVERHEGMKRFLGELKLESLSLESDIEEYLSNLGLDEEMKLAYLEDEDQDEDREEHIGLPQSNRKGKLTTIKDNHKGSAKSMLDKCGHLIDMAVPDVGDKSKFELELKIPVEPSGVGFVGMRLLMQSERKKAKQLNTRCELTVTGGAKVGGLAELKAELGGYFESEGEDSKMVMRMISYALYRRFVESSVLPVEISNFMWGGSTSNVGYNRAEEWAANVEKESFGLDDEGKARKNYVETGALLGATASGGIKDVGGMGLSGKIGVKNSIGNRYDHKSLAVGRGGKENIGNKSHKYSKERFYAERGKEFSDEEGGQSRVQPKIGRAAYQFELPFEGKAGIFKVSGKLKVVALEDTSLRKRFVKNENGERDERKAKSLLKRMSKDEVSFEIGAEIAVPFTKDVLVGGPSVIGGLLNTVVKIASQTSEKKKVGQKAGIIKSMAEDIAISAIAMNNVSDSAFKFISPLKGINDLGALKDSCSGSVGIKLGYKGKYKPGDASGDDLKKENKDRFKKSALSQEISLDYVKTGTFVVVDKVLDIQKNLIDVFSFKQESSNRLFILRYEKGGDWVINPETALEYKFEKKKVNDEDNVKSQPKNSDEDNLDWEIIYHNVYGKNKGKKKQDDIEGQFKSSEIILDSDENNVIPKNKTNSDIKKRKKKKKRVRKVKNTKK